jgi:hypothetical protein
LVFFVDAMSEPQQDVFDAKAAGWDSNPSILQATSAAAEVRQFVILITMVSNSLASVPPLSTRVKPLSSVTLV